jgi:hypothetical protein
MPKVTIFQGEAKPLPFRVKDKSTRKWSDLTGATCLLVVKRSPEDEDPVFTKFDVDFNKAGAASGYLSVFLTTGDTWQEPWTYMAELRVTGSDSPALVAKLRFDLEILQAISPSDFIVVPEGVLSQEAIGALTIS